VPRIVCKDGTVLSVQASVDHYASCDSIKWTFLEVACLENAPANWSANNEYFTQAYRHHDCTGWVIGNDYGFTVYMHVAVEEVKTFIDSHGGEAENQPDSISRPIFRDDIPSRRVLPDILTEGAKITHDGKHLTSENRPLD
jgi:GR25 family glycosyltransferase involved in LPS biosynthesis